MTLDDIKVFPDYDKEEIKGKHYIKTYFKVRLNQDTYYFPKEYIILGDTEEEKKTQEYRLQNVIGSEYNNYIYHFFDMGLTLNTPGVLRESQIDNLQKDELFEFYSNYTIEENVTIVAKGVTRWFSNIQISIEVVKNLGNNLYIGRASSNIDKISVRGRNLKIAILYPEKLVTPNNYLKEESSTTKIIRANIAVTNLNSKKLAKEHNINV